MTRPIRVCRSQEFTRLRATRIVVAACVCVVANTAHAATISWGELAGGYWDEVANWVGGALPSSADEALLGLTGSRIITYRRDDTSIASLRMRSGNRLFITGGSLSVGALSTDSVNATITIQGGIFNVDHGAFRGITIERGTMALAGVLDATGPITLAGGTLRGGTVRQSVAGALTFAPTFSSGVTSTLDGVTVLGDLNIGTASGSGFADASITHGLTVLTLDGSGPGLVNVGTSTGARDARLDFAGTQTFDNAVVNLGNSSYGARIGLGGSGSTFTLGAGAAIRGHGAIGVSGADFVNRGTVLANVPGRPLAISPGGAFSNLGTLEAADGGVLTIQPSGQWSNLGRIKVADAASRVNLGGTFDAASIGMVDNTAGGTLGLVGTLLNTGRTLDLATIGTLTIDGGTIVGGTVRQSGASVLTFAGGGTLDGAAVRGDLNIAGHGGYFSVSVRNGLTLQNQAGDGPGFLNVRNLDPGDDYDPSVSLYPVLTFEGTQTFDNAVMNLNGGVVSFSQGAAFTLGANAMLQGGGSIGPDSGPGTFINNGKVRADGRGISVCCNIVNHGQVEARNGGQVDIWMSGSSVNTGVIRVADAASTIRLLGGNLTTAALGSIDNSAGGTLSLHAPLDNTGSTLNLAAIGPLTLVGGGRVRGGTVQQSGTGVLRFAAGSAYVLDGITVRGALNIGEAALATGYDSALAVIVRNGLTVLDEAGAAPGVVTVGSGMWSGIELAGTQTFDNATIRMGGPVNPYRHEGHVAFTEGGSFTLGARGAIRGAGIVGYSIYTGSSPGDFVNRGVVSADMAGRMLQVRNQGSFTNTGTLEAVNGGTLVIQPGRPWSNDGVIRLADAGSSVILGGTFDVAALRRVDNAARGTLALAGTLNNAGATLDLSSTGSLTMASGGRIVGGTVRQSSADVLRFASDLDAASPSGTLDGVTVRGDLNVGDAMNSWYARAVIRHGLVVRSADGSAPGVVNVGVPDAYATLEFAGTQTFDHGVINLGGAGTSGFMRVTEGGTFTLGAGATIRGAGDFSYPPNYGPSDGSFVIDGTVRGDVAGRGLSFHDYVGVHLTNNGLIEARNGGRVTLDFSSGDTLSNRGLIRVADADSRIALSGILTTAALGRFDNAAGGSLSFYGTLNNTGATLDLSSATGPLTLVTTSTFLGGTVQQSGTGVLVFGGDSADSTTLTGVTVRGALNIGDAANPDAHVTVNRSLTVLSEDGTAAGVVNVGTAPDSRGAALDFAGTQTFERAVVNLGNAGEGGTVGFAGSGTFTLGADATIRGNGRIGDPSGSGNSTKTKHFVNQGSVLADVAGRTLGIYNRGNVTNYGRLEARDGATLAVAPEGAFDNAGIVRVASASTFSSGVTFTNLAAGTVRLDGGTLSGATLANAGTIRGAGRVTPRVGSNTGVVRASGGSLELAAGLQGAAGTVETLGDASLVLGGTSPNTAGTLNHAGTLLALGAQDLTIYHDYMNAGSGSGNAFDRRAGVSGSGRILAGGDVAQAITGANVGNGNTANATLTIGNVRVGASAFDYRIANAGTTGTMGPVLRGAIQTAVNGASLTDARLSGSGVTAGNFVAGGPGADSGNLAVVFNAAGAGTLAPLSGQAINLRSNFDNIADQKLAIVLASGAAAYVPAAGTLNTAPLDFGTVQVGQQVSRVLSIGTTAVGPIGFVEDLNARFGARSGSGATQISGSGSVNGLRAGASDASAMTVRVDTSVAGAIDGAIRIDFFSAGTVDGQSKGLAEIGVGSVAFGVSGVVQTSGNVINQARPLLGVTAIDLGAVRVGAPSPTRFVGVTNQATAAPQAALNASIGAAAPIVASGSFALLAPGATNASALRVGMDTGAAGVVSGTATIAFVSDASNVGNCAPNCQLVLAPQEVAVSGRVYAPALARLDSTVVDFGIVHKGDIVARNVAVANAAPPVALNDELRGTFGGAGGPFTASGTLAGVAAGATDATSFTAALDTANAGVFHASATATFASHNAEMSDLSLGSSEVTLKAQVNEYAQLGLGKLSGSGVLTRDGSTYTLDFGSVVLGTGTLGAELGVFNLATGPADLLQGTFMRGAGSGFTFEGSSTFAGIAAGAHQGGFRIGFDSAALGDYRQTLTISASGTNASGFEGALGVRTLVLSGSVAAVPEPATWALFAGGLAALVLRGRQRCRSS